MRLEEPRIAPIELEEADEETRSQLERAGQGGASSLVIMAVSPLSESRSGQAAVGLRQAVVTSGATSRANRSICCSIAEVMSLSDPAGT